MVVADVIWLKGLLRPLATNLLAKFLKWLLTKFIEAIVKGWWFIICIRDISVTNLIPLHSALFFLSNIRPIHMQKEWWWSRTYRFTSNDQTCFNSKDTRDVSTYFHSPLMCACFVGFFKSTPRADGKRKIFFYRKQGKYTQFWTRLINKQT